MNSREKGKRGERQAAQALREYGYDCRRGVQYSGANGDADVVGLPGVHLEIKYREHLNIFDAMSQSVHDARQGEIPVVMHRKNNSDWIVTMSLENFINLYREWAKE
jgi:Holliday junction resolvase